MSHNFQKQKASSKVSVTNDNRLPGKPLPPFVLAHHPESFEFIDGEFLPKIKAIRLIPGVNGHTNNINGHMPVLVNLRQNRWTVLDDTMPIKVTDPETGEVIDDAGYMVEWEGQKGPHYSDAWCTPMLIGSGNGLTVDWSTGYDHAGYNAWRKWLMAEGHIQPPSPAVTAKLLKIQEKRAGRRLGESHDGNPHVQSHVKNQQDKLAAMKAASEPEKPRRARARKKKATTDG